MGNRQEWRGAGTTRPAILSNTPVLSITGTGCVTFEALVQALGRRPRAGIEVTIELSERTVRGTATQVDELGTVLVMGNGTQGVVALVGRVDGRLVGDFQ